MRDRISKPERREAKRLWPRECHRSGVNVTARRLRDGWGPIRITMLDEHGVPVRPPFESLGKVTWR